MSYGAVKRPSREQVRAPAGRSSKPSIISGRSSTASAKVSISSAKPSAGSKASVKEEVKKWDLPALSITRKPKITESELEKMKKRTIRRNAPPGEDMKHIKSILKSIKGQKVDVNEFISLIAPSTGDRGETLRKVMNDDLNSFRKLARKVYETITKDNSDVLLNQQMQLADFYRERKILLNDKMMKYIEEIYSMVPKFDFDRYAKEGNKYLEEILPIPAEMKVEPEEYEMMKRQAAYHRLQWLRSEGIRLNEENNSLKKHLNQLKRLHKEEQERMMDLEREAEAKKEALEAAQAQKVEELEMLNDSLEKTIIQKEKNMRIEKDKKGLLGPLPSKTELKKKSKGKTKKQRPPWAETAAKELESEALERSEAAEKSRRPVSPFHFSPPRVPEANYVSTPRAQEPPKTRQPPPQRLGRRTAAPRDTWDGFY